ncbi:MAG: STAS domain-containing protein [Bacteroidetes bacterium]|jgi:anti-anti-sigma factor|nr:STAS domain-containing protein [Bacteroidota bacterium]
MLKAEFKEDKKTLTLGFAGHIDTILSTQYEQELKEALAKTPGFTEDQPLDLDLILDLKDVTYIASSFIRICVYAAKQVPKGRFTIVNSNPMIKKTFKIVGMDDLLQVS